MNEEVTLEELKQQIQGQREDKIIVRIGVLNDLISQIEKQQAEIEKKDKIIKSAYREANNVLYFDDNLDYCCALWEILRIINPELEEYPTLNYIDEEDK